MPARFRTAEATIRWSGTDDTTPPGYSAAVGTDSLDTPHLWLFKGDAPSDEAFVGSISIPTRTGQTPIAYGSGGGFAGPAPDTKQALARLAECAV